MKVLRPVLLGTLICLISSHNLIAGKWIAREDLVSEEDASYLPQYVSVRKFVDKAKALSAEEREEITGLNLDNCLLRASGIKLLENEALSLFPNLSSLIISHNGLDNPEDAVIIFDILSRFPKLEYVAINGNGIAFEPQNLISLASHNSSLLELLRSKVVVSMKSTVQVAFSSPDLKEDQEWQETQNRFHRWWASEEPTILLGH